MLSEKIIEELGRGMNNGIIRGHFCMFDDLVHQIVHKVVRKILKDDNYNEEKMEDRFKKAGRIVKEMFEPLYRLRRESKEVKEVAVKKKPSPKRQSEAVSSKKRKEDLGSAEEELAKILSLVCQTCEQAIILARGFDSMFKKTTLKLSVFRFFIPKIREFISKMRCEELSAICYNFLERCDRIKSDPRREGVDTHQYVDEVVEFQKELDKTTVAKELGTRFNLKSPEISERRVFLTTDKMIEGLN